jgi:two-component system, chemotaxis family, chemotaxis protein CheY
MDSLVIEDDLTTRLILGKWLSAFGESESTSNGFEGIDAFRLALKSGCPYQLVCLDINMPGLDGHETLAAIRDCEKSFGIEVGQGAKILMVTANEDSTNVLQAFNGQCDGYMVKPLVKAKLMKNLADLGFELG